MIFKAGGDGVKKFPIARLRSWLAGVLIFMISAFVSAADLSQSPSLNNGAKWRLGYYQGGEYIDYFQYLKVTTEGLVELGWVEPVTIPEDLSTAKALWYWLADHVQSDYLEFPKANFYSAEWDREHREILRQKVIQRLSDSREIDLILAVGTWAGLDMVTTEHQIPTMVMSVSDPRSVGLMRVSDDADYNHIYITENPDRYLRQVSLFHDLIRFKTLGVAYENSFEGRSYASIETIEKLAAERGFNVVSCHTLSDIADRSVANRSVIDCFNKLATKVDAIYVTNQGGINNETIPQLVSIANEHGIPTFSQYGKREVKLGYLMSLSGMDDFRSEGRDLSENMARIFNGQSPGLLTKTMEETGRIILNLATAEQIGLYLDADLLAAADQLYWKIELP